MRTSQLSCKRHLAGDVLRHGVWRCRERGGWTHGSGDCVESDRPKDPVFGRTAAQWCWCLVAAFKKQQDLSVPPDWQRDLFRMEPKFSHHFQFIIGWAPRKFELSIVVQIQLLISRDNGVEAGLGTGEQQQQNSCLDPALALRLGHLVEYRRQQRGQEAKWPQRLDHG